MHAQLEHLEQGNICGALDLKNELSKGEHEGGTRAFDAAGAAEAPTCWELFTKLKLVEVEVVWRMPQPLQVCNIVDLA